MTEVAYASAIWKARIIGSIMAIVTFFIGITVFGWYRAATGIPSEEVSYMISAIVAPIMGYATFLIAKLTD